MRYQSFLLCLTTCLFFCISVSTTTGKQIIVTTRGRRGNRQLSDKLVLVDHFLNTTLGRNIEIIDIKASNPSQQDIINMYKNMPIGKCYDAMREHTGNLNEGYHRLMELYSFKDLGDSGSYDGCRELSGVAKYNVLNMNITRLPVDIRLGVCLPKECSQTMMDTAQDPISSALAKSAYFIGEVLGIGFVVKYHVGFVISFVQPEAWFETRAETKTVGAILVLSLMGIFFIMLVVFSLMEYYRKPKATKSDVIRYDNPVDNDIERTLETDETIVKDTTNADSLRRRVINITTGSNISEIVTFAAGGNSQDESACTKISTMDDGVSTNCVSPILKYRSITPHTNPLYNDFVDCFSVRKNLFSLNNSRIKNEEDKDLQCLEGIRVLTMCWALITMTCVYILTMNCRNLYLMIGYFNTYAFALIVSGIITPDLFIFFIYFLGFVGMTRYYDQNGGIGPWDYLKLYAHRFFKLAPMYYFVFFFGWMVFSFMSDSAGWFVTERLFKRCEDQWYYILPFLNNLVPFFTKCLEGCYYWPYVISNDMLLHTLFPLWIIVYKRNKVTFYILNSFFLVGGFFINGFITWKNDLKVGIFTFEDYYLYSSLFNKPYTKLVAVSLGMFMGLFYLRLLKYRKASLMDKVKEFQILHFVHGSKIVTICLYIYSIAMLNFITGVTLTANQSGYNWTTPQNIIFFSLSRFGYITSIMTTIMILLTGKGDLVKRFLSQPLWTPFSRLSFIVYLIFPLVIGAGYYATNTQMFVNYTVSTVSMVSNIALSYLAALFFFLLLEKPIENMKNLAYTRMFESKKASHVAVSNQNYLKLKEIDDDVIADFKGHLLTNKGK